MKAKKNDEEVFKQAIFSEIFKQVAQDCYISQMEVFFKLFEDKGFYESVMESIATEKKKEEAEDENSIFTFK